MSIHKEIHAWFDIKPSTKDLRRLVDRGEKGNSQWYLDGKTFVGTAKIHAIKALKRRMFSEYMDRQGRNK